jgi:DNA-binding NarL/FixJ family response regulator
MDVLLIDAQPKRRRRIARALLSRGHEVRCAGQPSSARAALRLRAPELIALDGSMPGLPSGDLLAELERDPRTFETQVILLSRNDRSLFAAAVRLMGMRVVQEAEGGDELMAALMAAALSGQERRTMSNSHASLARTQQARADSGKLIEQTRSLLLLARAGRKE